MSEDKLTCPPPLRSATFLIDCSGGDAASLITKSAEPRLVPTEHARRFNEVKCSDKPRLITTLSLLLPLSALRRLAELTHINPAGRILRLTVTKHRDPRPCSPPCGLNDVR